MTFLCKCGNICNAHAWGGNAQAICHRCGRQWEYQRMDDGQDWVEVVTSWEERCREADRWIALKEADRKEQQRIAMECERERDEARAEVARLRNDPKADARAVIEEWRAKAERAWSDATWAQEQRVAMLDLLKRCRTHLPTPRRNDTPYGQLVAAVHAAIAGQPAPAKPVVDDAMVERAQTAYTDTIVRSMASYSDELVIHPMRAALVAALEGR